MAVLRPLSGGRARLSIVCGRLGCTVVAASSWFDALARAAGASGKSCAWTIVRFMPVAWRRLRSASAWSRVVSSSHTSSWLRDANGDGFGGIHAVAAAPALGLCAVVKSCGNPVAAGVCPRRRAPRVRGRGADAWCGVVSSIGRACVCVFARTNEVSACARRDHRVAFTYANRRTPPSAAVHAISVICATFVRYVLSEESLLLHCEVVMIVHVHMQLQQQVLEVAHAHARTSSSSPATEVALEHEVIMTAVLHQTEQYKHTHYNSTRFMNLCTTQQTLCFLFQYTNNNSTQTPV